MKIICLYAGLRRGVKTVHVREGGHRKMRNLFALKNDNAKLYVLLPSK